MTRRNGRYRSVGAISTLATALLGTRMVDALPGSSVPFLLTAVATSIIMLTASIMLWYGGEASGNNSNRADMPTASKQVHNADKKEDDEDGDGEEEERGAAKYGKAKTKDGGSAGTVAEVLSMPDMLRLMLTIQGYVLHVLRVLRWMCVLHAVFYTGESCAWGFENITRW